MRKSLSLLTALLLAATALFAGCASDEEVAVVSTAPPAASAAAPAATPSAPVPSAATPAPPAEESAGESQADSALPQADSPAAVSAAAPPASSAAASTAGAASQATRGTAPIVYAPPTEHPRDGERAYYSVETDKPCRVWALVTMQGDHIPTAEQIKNSGAGYPGSAYRSVWSDSNSNEAPYWTQLFFTHKGLEAGHNYTVWFTAQELTNANGPLAAPVSMVFGM